MDLQQQQQQPGRLGLVRSLGNAALRAGLVGIGAQGAMQISETNGVPLPLVIMGGYAVTEATVGAIRWIDNGVRRLFSRTRTLPEGNHLVEQEPVADEPDAKRARLSPDEDGSDDDQVSDGTSSLGVGSGHQGEEARGNDHLVNLREGAVEDDQEASEGSASFEAVDLEPTQVVDDEEEDDEGGSNQEESSVVSSDDGPEVEEDEEVDDEDDVDEDGVDEDEVDEESLPTQSDHATANDGGRDARGVVNDGKNDDEDDDDDDDEDEDDDDDHVDDEDETDENNGDDQLDDDEDETDENNDQLDDEDDNDDNDDNVVLVVDDNDDEKSRSGHSEDSNASDESQQAEGDGDEDEDANEEEENHPTQSESVDDDGRQQTQHDDEDNDQNHIIEEEDLSTQSENAIYDERLHTQSDEDDKDEDSDGEEGSSQESIVSSNVRSNSSADHHITTADPTVRVMDRSTSQEDLDGPSSQDRHLPQSQCLLLTPSSSLLLPPSSSHLSPRGKAPSSPLKVPDSKDQALSRLRSTMASMRDTFVMRHIDDCASRRATPSSSCIMAIGDCDKLSEHLRHLRDCEGTGVRCPKCAMADRRLWAHVRRCENVCCPVPICADRKAMLAKGVAARSTGLVPVPFSLTQHQE